MNDLTTPFGNGPQSLRSPIPGGGASQLGPTASPATPFGKISMPPMEIQAGQERQPAAASGSTGGMSPDEVQALQEAKQAAAGGGSSSTLSSEEQAHLDEARQMSAGSEKQGPPESTGLTGTAVGSSPGTSLVKMPSGNYGILENGGQVRELSPNERASAHYVAKALRIGGPTLTAILGGLGFGIPGAMVGNLAGAEVAHPIASQLEQIAGEKPQERGIKERATEVLLPAVLPAIGESLAASGIQNIGKDAIPALTEAASAAAPSVIENAAQQRVAASEASGVPLTKGEINAENPKVVAGEAALAKGEGGEAEQAKYLEGKAARDQQILTRIADIKKGVGPQPTDEQAKGFSTKSFFDNLSDMHEAKIADFKAKAYVASGGAKLPEPSIELSSAINDVLDKRGVEPPTSVAKLQNEIGATGGRGITLKRLDQFTAQMQDEANFGSPSRTPDNRVAGEIAHKAKLIRDDTMTKVLHDVGDMQSSIGLKAERNFYHSHIERIEKFQNELEQDPSMGGSIRAIVKKNNPADVSDFLSMLPEEQASQAKRLIADDIIPDPERGKLSEWAKTTESNLKSYDLKTLDPIFEGGTGDLKKLINVTKSIKHIAPEAVESSAAGKELVQLATRGRFSMIRKVALKVLTAAENKPTAAEYLNSKEVVPLQKQLPATQAPSLSELASPTTGAAIGAAAKPILTGTKKEGK